MKLFLSVAYFGNTFMQILRNLLTMNCNISCRFRKIKLYKKLLKILGGVAGQMFIKGTTYIHNTHMTKLTNLYYKNAKYVIH